jgi:predicted nucleic acid-binding protein
MKPLFADTSYFVAVLSEGDEFHRRALEWSANFLGQLFTTEYILVELGNAFSRSKVRAKVEPYIRDIVAAQATNLIPASLRLFSRGLTLYGQRPDKAWSLVDCISFVVMKERHITDALTSDRHFEQAGFKALLN